MCVSATSIEFHTTGENLNKVLLPLLVADSSSLGVGELEITPVSAAIARYLGIDLTAEGRAARNRRGIAHPDAFQSINVWSWLEEKQQPPSYLRFLIRPTKNAIRYV